MERVNTPEINIEVNDEYIDINEDTYIILNMDYYIENKEFKWDIRRILFKEFISSNNLEIIKYVEPPKSEFISEELQKLWSLVSSRNHPYNGRSFTNENGTGIGFIKTKSDENIKNQAALYGVYLGLEGKYSSRKMAKFMKELDKNITIY